MRILSIDPGYERVGIAIIEKNKTGKPTLIFSECLITDKILPFPERLTIIGLKLEHLIHDYSPTVLAIETLFFNTNQKTALKVSEARGVMLYCAQKSGLEICEYTPLQIKNALTGYGRAKKDQVDQMTRQLINIEKEIKYDDEMDAIATGLTCEASYGNILD